MHNTKPDATSVSSANTETGTPVGLDFGAVTERDDEASSDSEPGDDRPA
ncbi:MAG: hypothetical protein ABR591_13790 [Candidatus Velthaea sp.]